MINEKDQLERRCPRLGSEVLFGYCRICGDDKSACFKIFDCWWERFEVVEFLKENLPKEEFERLQELRPKAKITSLVEIIQQAKMAAKRRVS